VSSDELHCKLALFLVGFLVVGLLLVELIVGTRLVEVNPGLGIAGIAYLFGFAFCMASLIFAAHVLDHEEEAEL